MPQRDALASTTARSPRHAQATSPQRHDAAIEQCGEGQGAHRAALTTVEHGFDDRRLPAALITVLLLAVLALTGCSSDAERDDAGAVTAADDVAVDRLRVGDCLNTPADGVVEDLAAVPCEQEHDGEVFHAFDLPDGEFPGAEPVRVAGEAGCLAQFEPFVGTAFDDSELGLLPLTPVADGWAAGDQGVVCIVQDEQGGLTATLRDARR